MPVLAAYGRLADQSIGFLTLKILLWALLGLPAALTCWRYFRDLISYGEAIHQTGQWSVALLIVALAITPLRRVFRGARWTAQLAAQRRGIGVASFAYAALHTGFYLERKWGAGLILSEGVAPSLATGWIAFAIFLLLAATSNDASVRAMRVGWKRLHRSVYAATALTFAHWWLATFDPTAATICLALLIAVQLLRLVPSKWR